MLSRLNSSSCPYVGGGSNTGTRLRGGRDMQTRNMNLIIPDLVGSTRHAWHLGTTTGNAGPRERLGVHNWRTQEGRRDGGRWTIPFTIVDGLKHAVNGQL
jgi:hypothetical protein